MALLTQRTWRIVGGVCVGICAVMAWFGVQTLALRNSPTLFLAYWGVFFVLFVVVLYCVLLDLRYIRMQHALGERQAFQDILGDEKFRAALRQAQQEANQREVSEKNRNRP
ncbi:MAG: hypothetical protein K1Y02_13595 [Candidatus Hydrogenedentes bacterium]|nr:hypothetical protein [Candidatus Hydrogenedentota bacterium]